MGLEHKDCLAVIKNEEHRGSLHVDSQKLEFRSSGIRWEVPVGKGTRARHESGFLIVTRGSKKAQFETGDQSEKWVEKTLNPPSRLTKLGTKTGQTFWLSDEETDLEEELVAAKLSRVKQVPRCNLAFVFVDSESQLGVFERTYRRVKQGTHLWVVWPKGINSIRQADVIGAARVLGMGPGKVMAFDDYRTAMRFTKK
ncbi:MAG: hypothetical protein AAF802_05810 [Planctomycetota bacterium]